MLLVSLVRQGRPDLLDFRDGLWLRQTPWGLELLGIVSNNEAGFRGPARVGRL